MSRYRAALWVCMFFATVFAIDSIVTGEPELAGSIWTAAVVVLYGQRGGNVGD